jgi:hypothetical protein
MRILYLAGLLDELVVLVTVLCEGCFAVIMELVMCLLFFQEVGQSIHI